MKRSLRRVAAFVLTLLFVLAIPHVARAHKPSDSYLTLRVAGARVEGRWDIALRDLDYVLQLDTDDDGAVTWGELRARHDDVRAFALGRLKVAEAGVPCALRGGEQLVAAHSDGAYTTLSFSAQCAHEIRSLDVEYGLFFDVDKQHRGLLRLEAEGATRSATFSALTRVQTFEVNRLDRGAQLWSFITLGVHHIWEGYDHLAFLLALLLPSVLRRENGRWAPVAAFRPALVDVLKIVTAFTLAHSITLSLSALGVVRLPSRFVESAIAASVLLAAVNNLAPIVRQDRWFYAFALGLMHGFGFSATLMDLDLPRGSLVATLFGFNLGVEIGQASVVAVFLPLAFWMRRSRAYRLAVLTGGSIVIALFACVWLVERAFNLRILS